MYEKIVDTKSSLNLTCEGIQANTDLQSILLLPFNKFKNLHIGQNIIIEVTTLKG